MKHLMIATLFCAALSIFAVAPLNSAPKSRSTTTAITVSPTPYTPGTPITLSGMNYVAGLLVYIDVDGASSFSISKFADRRGNFSVYIPAGLSLPQGNYVVTGHQPLGVSATTGLEVQ